jgi:peroxiredoxin
MSSTQRETQPEEPAGSPPGPEPAATDNRHRPLVVTAVLAAVGAVALVAAFVGGDGTDPGDPLTLPFVYDDGTTGTLADLDGEPVVVNFFAGWCAPCRAEIPGIESVHVAAGDEVHIIGISHDFDESTWHSFVEETGLTYETAFQPQQEIWQALDLSGMPSTVLISADGRIVHTHTGIIDEATLRDLIAEHLDVRI